ncbi:MAG: DUF1799 domain-containing protein [Pseudomonadota bacterium]
MVGKKGRSPAADEEQIDAALAAFGLVREGGLPDDSLGVWPENWQAVQVFADMATQWHIGPSGAYIGLRYEALAVVMQIHGVGKAQRRELFEALRIMETAALEAMSNG